MFLAWELGFINAGESQAESAGVMARIGRVAARSGRLVLVEQLITRVMRQSNHTQTERKKGKIQDSSSRTKISRKLESSIAQNMSYRVLFGSFGAFAIKIDEFCVANDGFCIRNDDLNSNGQR